MLVKFTSESCIENVVSKNTLRNSLSSPWAEKNNFLVLGL